jgi:hypothetical protein
MDSPCAGVAGSLLWTTRTVLSPIAIDFEYVRVMLVVLDLIFLGDLASHSGMLIALCDYSLAAKFKKRL